MNSLIGRLIICFLLLITSAYSFADDNQAENNDDYNILLNAKTFSVGGTSYAGTPTKETIAFKHIFLAKNAHVLFEKIMENGSLEGKLYALSGLYYYDYRTYKMTVEKYMNVDDIATIFSGCILRKVELKELMKSKSENVVRLSNNLQTIEAWRNENNVSNGFNVDFYGGGYPQLINEYIFSNDHRIKPK